MVIEFKRLGDVPREVRAAMRYRFTVAEPLKISGYCETFESLLSGVELRNVLGDTSQRHDGILLRESWTVRRDLTVIGAPVTIVGLADVELDGLRG